jgi:hypothetical protein
MLQIVQLPRRQIVDANDGVPIGQQHVGQMRTKKTCRTGNKDSHLLQRALLLE